MPSKRVLRVYKIICINIRALKSSFDSSLFAFLQKGAGGCERAIRKQKKGGGEVLFQRIVLSVSSGFATSKR